MTSEKEETAEVIITHKWAMPNKDTFSIKPITNFIKENIPKNGNMVDPFVGNNPFGLIYFNKGILTNDLNPEINADKHLDALDFLKNIPSKSTDCVFFDPPYSPRQISECYKGVGLDTNGGELTRSSFYSNLKNEIARITKIRGKVFCFGWNSQGIGMSKGFKMEKLLVVAHGGSHNDTLVTLEKKVVL